VKKRISIRAFLISAELNRRLVRLRGFGITFSEIVREIIINHTPRAAC
jgi:hypothetical protein